MKLSLASLVGSTLCQWSTTFLELGTGFKLGKEYVKTVYCDPAYLTYIQSTSCKMPGWMKHKLNQDCREKYQ